MEYFLLNEGNNNNEKATTKAIDNEPSFFEDDIPADIPSFMTNQTLASMMDMLKLLQMAQAIMKQQQVNIDIKLTFIFVLSNKPDSKPIYVAPPTMTDPQSFSQMLDLDIREIRNLDEFLQNTQKRKGNNFFNTNIQES